MKKTRRPKTSREIYRARADALWRDRDAARRAGDYASADVAERQARYWERLAVQATETRDERINRRIAEVTQS